MKEMILLYHPETPSIRSQVLYYRDKQVSNSVLLSSLFQYDTKPEVQLKIENVPEPSENMTGYKSELFKTREEEYIRKYDIARQLLLDTHHKPQETSVIPTYSVINSLPVTHPETLKRVRFMAQDTKPRKIRLRKLPFSVYFDFVTIFRWALFSGIIRMYLGASIPSIYYIFILICYIVNIRMKIEKHREKELAKLPREYLLGILPERYHFQREFIRSNTFLLVFYETTRGFLASLLPWFDPITYANQRNQAIN